MSQIDANNLNWYSQFFHEHLFVTVFTAVYNIMMSQIESKVILLSNLYADHLLVHQQKFEKQILCVILWNLRLVVRLSQTKNGGQSL